MTAITNLLFGGHLTDVATATKMVRADVVQKLNLTTTDFNLDFELPDKIGRLELSLQQAIRKSDKRPMFVLQNKATGLGEDKNMTAVWEWFEVAHEWIVFGFTDLTKEGIQKDVWQRTDIN